MILTIWFVVIVLEVWRNYHIIVVRKQSPNYAISTWLIRFPVAGLLWWRAWYWVDLDQWLTMPFMQVFTFAFLFNLLLNIARSKIAPEQYHLPYWYLGKKSWMDQWQINHGGAFLWFWIRFGLAAISLTLFVNGWRAIGSFA